VYCYGAILVLPSEYNLVATLFILPKVSELIVQFSENSHYQQFIKFREIRYNNPLHHRFNSRLTENDLFLNSA